MNLMLILVVSQILNFLFLHFLVFPYYHLSHSLHRYLFCNIGFDLNHLIRFLFHFLLIFLPLLSLHLVLLQCIYNFLTLHYLYWLVLALMLHLLCLALLYLLLLLVLLLMFLFLLLHYLLLILFRSYHRILLCNYFTITF